MSVPQWVRDEYINFAHPRLVNDDGSYDYRDDGSRTSTFLPNVAKAGVSIQGAFFGGLPLANADVQQSLTYVGNRWQNQQLDQGGNQCSGTVQWNKGCAYGMINVFKGFRLYNVATLAGVGRPAGPGPIPEDDWYADYVDWFVTNQVNPGATNGGNWPMSFSRQTAHDPAEAAIAELILAPVVLVPPDPDRFGSVGLQHGTPLSVNPDSNPVQTEHTVTAKAESGGANPSPIPGVLIAFDVNGRNDGVVGSCNPVNCVSGANGIVTYTYMDGGPGNAPGQDTIQAFIGQVGGQPASNIVEKNWVVPTAARCDANDDGSVTIADLRIIALANGQNASGPNDPRDGNGDMVINVADTRYCQRVMAGLQ
jgi:hypothetical protein